ncbi:MAG: transcription termination factor NusA [Clostridia bacterium]|nr:transcription termination factor NusA [Clostridia bacterium]
MNIEFIEAVEALEREKHISKDMLIDAIESALVSAYKKNYGTSQNVRVSIDRENGDIDVFMRRDIVEVVEDPFSQTSLEEAQEIDPEYELGDVIEYMVTPRDFGRIAAQTAKQVVVQRIRETERGMIFDDYISRQGEIVNGTVQRISNDVVFVNMGRAEGILAINEQIPGEKYRVNQRLKVYVMDVKRSTKGPQIFLSRTHPGFVKRLFELEVPEIQDGTVEIKSISREAGSRTKIAVCTYDENVDPVGSCVGTRGARVQAIVDELSGEKIDIINWSEEPGKLISSALSPAKAEMVLIDEYEKSATVVVPDFQLSLAIGKEGQNVRLAAKLCGWKIDIKSHSQFYASGEKEEVFTEGETVILKKEHQVSAEEENVAVEAYEETAALPSLKSMKKAELIAFAEENGIELDPKATNAVMIETIQAAMGE